jgi:hypothetical protein
MAKRDQDKAIKQTFEAFGLDRRKRADWDNLLAILRKARPRKPRGAPTKWTPALRKQFNDAVLAQKIFHRLTPQEYHDWFVSKLDPNAIAASAQSAWTAIVANPEFRARLGAVPDRIGGLDPGRKPHINEARIIMAMHEAGYRGGLPLPPGKKPFQDTIENYVLRRPPGSPKRKK